MIKTYTRDNAVIETTTTKAPTTEPEPTTPHDPDAKEEVTPSYLENRAFAAWGAPFCVKHNGDPHTNKTNGQIRARIRKVNAYVNFMKKYVGEKKRNIKCSKDVTIFVEDVDHRVVDPAADPEYAAMADITEAVIKAGYEACRPHKNWIKGAQKKLAAISAWRIWATNKDC